ncbi:MAG: class I SAM-dependent methyltransferase [Actinomycetota bacterium]
METERHEESRALWDQMAPGWDRNRDFMWRTTRHVAEWLVDQVHPAAGHTILDVAGGPGEIGFLAAKRVGPAGRVIETDFSPQMVAAARRRASELGLGNIETRVLDAQQMDLEVGSVDGIVCRWGFMLMDDPQTALAGCRRVLKEGGRLALSVWGGVDKNPWVTIPGMTMVQLGHQPGGDPFGPGGMFSMSDPETVRGMLDQAGFSDIVIEEMPVDWRYGSFDEAWDFMTQVAGAIATVIEELSPADVTELRAQLEANMQSFGSSEGLTLPGVTINASGS